MTDRQSFTDITEWMKLVENAPEMPFLLVGNKIDSPRCSMLLRAQHAACRLCIACVASEAPAVAHSRRRLWQVTAATATSFALLHDCAYLETR